MTKSTIDRLGLGCARLYGGADIKESRRLVETALALGIRYFDTAPYYGSGWSEQVLGDVLHGVDDVMITTKIGLGRPSSPVQPSPVRRLYRSIAKPVLARFPALKGKLLSAARGSSPQAPKPTVRAFPRDTLRAELDASLAALRRDRLYAMLVHEPDQFALDDDDRAAFQTLVDEGRIGSFGLGLDRTLPHAPAFGTIMQSRYLARAERDDTGISRIFHGVLRHRGDEKATTRLARILSDEPDARILLSVSTVGQLRELHNAARGIG
ncbi:MAG: aldo/keto reductase [Sphingomonas sp.]|nr:aldo/keto reductase [Sphingomonas sp.]